MGISGYHNFRLPLLKKGLGISSTSGSHTGGSKVGAGRQLFSPPADPFARGPAPNGLPPALGFNVSVLK